MFLTLLLHDGIIPVPCHPEDIPLVSPSIVLSPAVTGSPSEKQPAATIVFHGPAEQALPFSRCSLPEGENHETVKPTHIGHPPIAVWFSEDWKYSLL
jgi:hypothetical protein